LRYAIEYHYRNPTTDIIKHHLPPLEELVEGPSL
jgi:hypothetical protein